MASSKRNHRTRLWIAQQGRCFYCGHKIRSKVVATIDHVIPKTLGGPNSIWNLVLACRWCNTNKGGQMPSDDDMDRRAAMEELVQSIEICEGKCNNLIDSHEVPTT